MFKRFFEKREKKADQRHVALAYRIIRSSYPEINPLSRKHLTETFAHQLRVYVAKWGWDNYAEWFYHRYRAFVDFEISNHFYVD
jgi:hypothetical protein